MRLCCTTEALLGERTFCSFSSSGFVNWLHELDKENSWHYLIFRLFVELLASLGSALWERAYLCIYIYCGVISRKNGCNSKIITYLLCTSQVAKRSSDGSKKNKLSFPLCNFSCLCVVTCSDEHTVMFEEETEITPGFSKKKFAQQ